MSYLEKKEHIHTQHYPYRFQSTLWAAPKGGDGRAIFGVESMTYITGSGWNEVDPFEQNNKFIIAFINYVKTKELMGYKHAGKSSLELENYFKNLWKVDKIG